MKMINKIAASCENPIDAYIISGGKSITKYILYKKTAWFKTTIYPVYQRSKANNIFKRARWKTNNKLGLLFSWFCIFFFLSKFNTFSSFIKDELYLWYSETCIACTYYACLSLFNTNVIQHMFARVLRESFFRKQYVIFVIFKHIARAWTQLLFL